MILMNHVERTPMKKLLTKFYYVLAVVALLTVFANMIAISLYVFAIVAIVCSVAYFHLRT